MPFNPPPGGGYILSGGVWAPMTGVEPAASGPGFTPPPVSLYVYNNSLGQWVPWDGTPVDGSLTGDVTVSGGVATVQKISGSLASVDGMAALAPGVGVPVAKTVFTGQAANVSTSTFYTTPNDGHVRDYLVAFYSVLTVAAGTSSTLPQTFISYTDADTGVVISGGLAGTSTSNTVGGSRNYGTFFMRCKPNTAVQFATSGYASVPANAMTYNAYMYLMCMGME